MHDLLKLGTTGKPKVTCKDCQPYVLGVKHQALRLCSHALRVALCGRWWQLPDVGVWPQLGMLMCFQRLVELQESTRILMDLGQPAHNPNHQYAELKVRLPLLSGCSDAPVMRVLAGAACHALLYEHDR